MLPTDAVSALIEHLSGSSVRVPNEIPDAAESHEEGSVLSCGNAGSTETSNEPAHTDMDDITYESVGIYEDNGGEDSPTLADLSPNQLHKQLRNTSCGKSSASASKVVRRSSQNSLVGMRSSKSSIATEGPVGDRRGARPRSANAASLLRQSVNNSREGSGIAIPELSFKMRDPNDVGRLSRRSASGSVGESLSRGNLGEGRFASFHQAGISGERPRSALARERKGSPLRDKLWLKTGKTLAQGKQFGPASLVEASIPGTARSLIHSPTRSERQSIASSSWRPSGPSEVQNTAETVEYLMKTRNSVGAKLSKNGYHINLSKEEICEQFISVNEKADRLEREIAQYADMIRKQEAILENTSAEVSNLSSSKMSFMISDTSGSSRDLGSKTSREKQMMVKDPSLKLLIERNAQSLREEIRKKKKELSEMKLSPGYIRFQELQVACNEYEKETLRLCNLIMKRKEEEEALRRKAGKRVEALVQKEKVFQDISKDVESLRVRVDEDKRRVGDVEVAIEEYRESHDNHIRMLRVDVDEVKNQHRLLKESLQHQNKLADDMAEKHRKEMEELHGAEFEEMRAKLLEEREQATSMNVQENDVSAHSQILSEVEDLKIQLKKLENTMEHAELRHGERTTVYRKLIEAATEVQELRSIHARRENELICRKAACKADVKRLRTRLEEDFYRREAASLSSAKAVEPYGSSAKDLYLQVQELRKQLGPRAQSVPETSVSEDTKKVLTLLSVDEQAAANDAQSVDRRLNFSQMNSSIDSFQGGVTASPIQAQPNKDNSANAVDFAIAPPLEQAVTDAVRNRPDVSEEAMAMVKSDTDVEKVVKTPKKKSARFADVAEEIPTPATQKDDGNHEGDDPAEASISTDTGTVGDSEATSSQPGIDNLTTPEPPAPPSQSFVRRGTPAAHFVEISDEEYDEDEDEDGETYSGSEAYTTADEGASALEMSTDDADPMEDDI